MRKTHFQETKGASIILPKSKSSSQKETLDKCRVKLLNCKSTHNSNRVFIKKITYILFFQFLCVLPFANGQSNAWYVFPPGVPEAANRYIYIDNSNQKWIGGYSNGMHKYYNGIWTHYTTSNSLITNDDVRQSCFDASGKLWIATWDKLNKFDTTSNVWTNFNVSGRSFDVLFSVQVDTNNRIWVGAGGGANSDDGLYLYDGNTWKFFNPTNSTLTGRWIHQLKMDLTGQLWGCHYRGLFEINDTVIINHLLQPAGFPSNVSATCVDFDSYNNKWVGVYDGGVGKFDDTNWTIYNASNSPLPENKIWCIAIDANNVVWIGTEDQGLVKFDGVNWTVYNTSNSPLTANRIDALAVDTFNNLWIAPSYGGIIVHNLDGISGICNSTPTSQSITSCNSYFWNGNTYTASGTYIDTIFTASGCDSVITLALTINSADTSVTVFADSLLANATNSSYQWLNCDSNYAIIPGATNQTYIPPARTGNYAVVVTQNGCTDTSQCYNAAEMGQQENRDNFFKVYPNPTNGIFNIEYTTGKDILYEITDISGRNIRKGKLEERLTTIDISEYRNGMYLVKIGTKTIQLIKK